MLQEQMLLYYDASYDRWAWDVGAIHVHDCDADGLAEFVYLHRLSTLSGDVETVLQIAACIGPRFCTEDTRVV